MRNVLVTGFEPFERYAFNTSRDIALALDGRTVAGRRIVSAELPNLFGTSRRRLSGLLRDLDPELVICLGLSGLRADLGVERVAINLDDARIPDNGGVSNIDTPIVSGGPVAYWSTLPIKAIVQALRKRDIPASVSLTAGSYVCNHVFYGLMHSLRFRRGIRGGFIHVPPSTEQLKNGDRALPHLPFDTLVKGIQIAIGVSLKMKRDARVPSGGLV
jgi:pyroglutamyl-peptidase